MNARKRKYFIISIMTDDAKDQGVYIVRDYHVDDALEEATRRFLKGRKPEDIPDYFREVLFKTKSAHDADIFLLGYSEGSSNQLGD